MSQMVNKVSEFRRFPFWGTLLGGIFLLFMIRIYWDPTLASNLSKNEKKDVWTNQQYAVWGPIWKYGFDRIAKGEIPHWNPYQLCGQPYLVDTRTSLFEPLHLLFWRMDFAPAYQWYIFLSLSLIGIGFLIWGRILEIPYPALIPGLVSMLFSGPVICAQMALPLLSGSVWLIFLLSGMVYFLENYTPRSFLVLLFIWTALVLSGSVECIFTGIVMLILFPFIFRRFLPLSIERKSLFVIFKIIGILLLGIMISAFTWFPFISWQIYTRGNWTQFMSFPLSAHFPETIYMSLFQMALPIWSWDLPELPVLYPGLICLTFIIPAFFDREFRSIVVFHGLILLSFFLLFFVNLDLARILQQGMLVLVAVSFSTLSGIGFYRLLLKGRDLSSPYVWVSGILVFLLLIALIIIGNPWIKGVSILLLILLIPATVIRIPKVNSVLCILIALLGFIELYYLLRPFLPESYIPVIEKKDIYSESIRQLRYQTGTGRSVIISEPNSILWSENLGMYYHWQLVNGTELPMDKYTQLWMELLSNHKKEKTELLNNPLITISGVQWAFASNTQKKGDKEKELKNWRKMEQIPFVDIYENTQPMPRCFWISHYKIVSSKEEVFNVLKSGEYSSFAECIIEAEEPISYSKKIPDTVPITLEENTATPPDMVTASIQEENPEYISIQIRAPKEGFLVLLDTYSPGWKAFIDGELTPIYRTNGIFRGIPIPGGVHQVVFKYTSPGWNTGRIITLVAILLTLALLLIEKFLSKRQTT
ncbi:MAG TPA: YfhO family protein [Candidatus Hydrogenedens sp.]|nr:YfhO family protein [Candidatus Hydrogenedens sp.]